MSQTDVIFVDDEPDIRKAIAQALTLDDLSVVCFDTAASALVYIGRDYSGVVPCDYNMPEIDGLPHCFIILY